MPPGFDRRRHQHEVGARGNHRFGRERPVAGMASMALTPPASLMIPSAAVSRPAAFAVRHRPSTAGTARGRSPVALASPRRQGRHLGAPARDHGLSLANLPVILPMAAILATTLS